MKRWLLLMGMLGLAGFSSITPGWASGLIVVHDADFWHDPMPRVGPPPDRRPPMVSPRPTWAPLELHQTRIHVAIRDQIASTTVEQEFYNPNARQLEGTFLFPVPKGAQINKFTMEINGKPVEAELLTAEKARGIYEDIVRRLRDPALLEYAGRDLFKVRVFPIEANERKRVRLAFSQLLPNDHGLVSYAYPLNTQRYSATPLKNVSLKIDLESRLPLKSIYSPSHVVEIRRQGERRATVGFEASHVKPDTDFQLYFAPEKDPIGLNLLTYRKPGEDGYFLLLASPGVDVVSGRTQPKDVCFVLDTSGSMAGAKLDQAKKALAFCVENLNAEDRFEVLRFATDVEPIFNRLMEADPAQRRRAQEFIREMKPTGGTAIDEALRKALALRPSEGKRPYVIVFLTDGRPTVGVVAEDKILANVKDGSRGNVRVFCFGIGTDVNTHLLDKITDETRAASEYVLPEEDIEVKVSGFFTRVKDPVLASPSVTFPENVRVTKLYPSPLPDLFKGGQIVLAGRYSGQGAGAVRIEGLVEGETRRFTQDITFPERSEDHEFIPRLWATRRVGYLLDEIRLRGENAELKDEVVDLARRYSIVTPYTAYLIVEDEGRRGVAANRRLFGDRAAAAESNLADHYFRFQQDKAGAGAVGGARSLSALKRAEAAADAISLGDYEASRTAQSAPTPAPATQPVPIPGTLDSGRGRGAIAATRPGALAGWTAEAGAVADAGSGGAASSQYVGGKTFLNQGGQWVDVELQKLPQAKPVRIQFGSADYFALLKQHPSTVPWLAQGANVQFVLNGQAYEIYE
ncbi:MAG: VWA domain-containing protein [Verrucomicrobia bacterium]|nr:VWA domain-containing protein [Verrucomicrobiota bacterium]